MKHPAVITASPVRSAGWCWVDWEWPHWRLWASDLCCFGRVWMVIQPVKTIENMGFYRDHNGFTMVLWDL